MNLNRLPVTGQRTVNSGARGPEQRHAGIHEVWKAKQSVALVYDGCWICWRRQPRLLQAEQRHVIRRRQGHLRRRASLAERASARNRGSHLRHLPSLAELRISHTVVAEFAQTQRASLSLVAAARSPALLRTGSARPRGRATGGGGPPCAAGDSYDVPAAHARGCCVRPLPTNASFALTGENLFRRCSGKCRPKMDRKGPPTPLRPA